MKSRFGSFASIALALLVSIPLIAQDKAQKGEKKQELQNVQGTVQNMILRGIASGNAGGEARRKQNADDSADLLLNTRVELALTLGTAAHGVGSVVHAGKIKHDAIPGVGIGDIAVRRDLGLNISAVQSAVDCRYVAVRGSRQREKRLCKASVILGGLRMNHSRGGLKKHCTQCQPSDESFGKLDRNDPVESRHRKSRSSHLRAS